MCTMCLCGEQKFQTETLSASGKFLIKSLHLI